MKTHENEGCAGNNLKNGKRIYEHVYGVSIV